MFLAISLFGIRKSKDYQFCLQTSQTKQKYNADQMLSITHTFYKRTQEDRESKVITKRSWIMQQTMDKSSCADGSVTCYDRSSTVKVIL